MSHINNFHLDYIDALRAEGHTVLVLAKGEGADFDIPFEKKILSSGNARCRKAIREIFKKEQFDAVILNTTLAAFHVRAAMPKKNRPKTVNIVHGYLFSCDTGFIKRNLFLFCERLLKGKTDSVIVMNGEDLKIATENRLASSRVFMCRGMGVKRRSVSSEAVSELLQKKGDKFVMSFVGELSLRKNQAFLISALPAIKEKAKNAALWLIGDGAERENLKRLANELGVGEAVHFFGAVPNPCDFISASDLYVSASVIEGLPFNIAEAMSCGAFVLASDVKGHRDMIEDGVSGMLYPLGDTESFVGKVLSYYQNGSCTDKQKICSAYEKYSFDSVFSETLGIMKESIDL